MVFNAEALGDAFDDVDRLFGHILVDFTRFAAHFHDEFGVNRNHVAAFAGGDLADVDTCHAGAVARDTQKLRDAVAGSGQSVAAGVRFNAGVCGTALKRDVVLRCAEEAHGACDNFTRLGHHGDVA